MVGVEAAARAAMQEDGRLSLRIAAHLPIDAVPVADVEHAGIVGLDRRIEAAKLGETAHRPCPAVGHVSVS